MTDRSSEERSRSNEETPKWVQTVASIRGELMTRFSDRLSMEEIASCAYAVAMRDGQGGTGMVEEERSRFEKLERAAGNIGANPHRDPDGRYASQLLEEKWRGWEARAGLEDRQEAAPTTVYLVSVTDGYDDKQAEIVFANEAMAKDHAYAMPRSGTGDFRIVTAVPFCPEPGVPSEATKQPCIYRAGCTTPERCLGEQRCCAGLPPVPSEATPSKENAPLPDHLFGSCRNSRDPELCAGCERIQTTAAPAPEVQGTPFKDAVLAMGGNESDAKAAILRAHAEGKVKIDMDWNVGTPQKETPTMPYGAGAQNFGAVREGPLEEEPPCEICGDSRYWHSRNLLGSHAYGHKFKSAAPVPEGVQGKEPQTPPDWKSGPAEKAVCEWIVVQHRPKDIAEFMPLLIAMRDEIFASGEAAGRRSAITEIQPLIEAVQKLHHWHDWGKDNEGMVVSSESVWAIWKARDACAELLEKK